MTSSAEQPNTEGWAALELARVAFAGVLTGPGAIFTAQVTAGESLGIAAQVFLVWVIIAHVMPFFGLELLDMARDVAAFNLPARVGQLFGVGL